MMYVTEEEAFLGVWCELGMVRARSVLQRTMVAARQAGVDLLLDYGTLLGCVREGRILPWDDDIDLALLGQEGRDALEQELNKLGLHMVHSDSDPDWIDFAKIYDPRHATIKIENYEYAWPFVDLWIYNLTDDAYICNSTEEQFSKEVLDDKKAVIFEETDCFISEKYENMLDRYYKDWRTTEVSNHWSHRFEEGIRPSFKRPIKTDGSGRKIV